MDELWLVKESRSHVVYCCGDLPRKKPVFVGFSETILFRRDLAWMLILLMQLNYSCRTKCRGWLGLCAVSHSASGWCACSRGWLFLSSCFTSLRLDVALALAVNNTWAEGQAVASSCQSDVCGLGYGCLEGREQVGEDGSANLRWLRMRFCQRLLRGKTSHLRLFWVRDEISKQECSHIRQLQP